MYLYRLGKPGVLPLMLVLLLLGVLVACGSSATSTPESPAATEAAATSAPTPVAATQPAAATQPSSASGAAPTAVPTPMPAAAGAPWVGVAAGGKHGGVVPTYHIGNPGVWDPHRSPLGSQHGRHIQGIQPGAAMESYIGRSDSRRHCGNLGSPRRRHHLPFPRPRRHPLVGRGRPDGGRRGLQHQPDD